MLVRRALAIVLVCCLSLGVSACAPASEDVSTDPRSVRLGVSKEGLSAFAYIARDEGIFERNGLDLSFIEFSSSQLARDALLEGQVDAALCADTPIVLGALEGRPVRIIATVATDANDIKIVARRDAGIESPADLRGKRVGTREGTAAHYFLHVFMLRHGLAADDIEFRGAPFEDVTAALIAGDLDAIAIREPFISDLERALGERFLLFEEKGLYEKTMNLCVPVTGPVPDDEVRRRLVKSLLEAEALALADRERARAEVAEDLGVSADQLCECIFEPESVRIAQSLLLSLEEQARWAIAAGRVPTATVTPDFLALLDTGPLDTVRPERVTTIR